MTSTCSHRISVVVDRSRFPTLFAFVAWRIDVQIAEVRNMLRLPMPEAGLESGHEFAAAASLVNLIAGASVWFHGASSAAVLGRDNPGRRYREVLAAYWPWNDGEVVGAAEGTRLLYECVRNPLAHAFGMTHLDGAGSPIAFLKEPLTAERVSELDLADTRPPGLGPTIKPATAPGVPARAYFVVIPPCTGACSDCCAPYSRTSSSCRAPRNAPTHSWRPCRHCMTHDASVSEPSRRCRASADLVVLTPCSWAAIGRISQNRQSPQAESPANRHLALRFASRKWRQGREW